MNQSSRPDDVDLMLQRHDRALHQLLSDERASAAGQRPDQDSEPPC